MSTLYEQIRKYTRKGIDSIIDFTSRNKKRLVVGAGVAGIGLTAGGCAGLDTRYLKDPDSMNLIQADVARTQLGQRAWEQDKTTSFWHNFSRLPIRLAEVVDAAGSTVYLEPCKWLGVFNTKYPDAWNYSRIAEAEETIDEKRWGRRLAWHVPHTVFRDLKAVGGLIGTAYNSTIAPPVKTAARLTRPTTYDDSQVFFTESKGKLAPRWDGVKKTWRNTGGLAFQLLEFAAYCVGENSGFVGDTLWAGDNKVARWAGKRGDKILEERWAGKDIDGFGETFNNRILLNFGPRELDDLFYGAYVRPNSSGIGYDIVPITTGQNVRLVNGFKGTGWEDMSVWRVPGKIITTGGKTYLNPAESRLTSAGKLAKDATVIFSLPSCGGSTSPTSAGRAGGPNTGAGGGN